MREIWRRIRSIILKTKLPKAYRSGACRTADSASPGMHRDGNGRAENSTSQGLHRSGNGRAAGKARASVYRAAAALLIAAALLTGCGDKVVLTSGFGAQEVFLIGETAGTVAELRIYLINLRNQYRSVFGEEVWAGAESDALEETVRSTALARLSKVKALTLMAKERGIALSEEEEALAQECAAAYEATLTEADKEALGVSEGDTLLLSMYEDYMLADKVYRSTIESINPEISDDEARSVQVESILFKTYRTDSEGNRIEYDEAQREEVRARAQSVLSQIQGGADFAEMISLYNEAAVSSYTFGKGEQDAAFEEAAFALDTGALSDVVETQDGYRIILCVSSFDEAQTEANKAKMLKERKDEVFGEQYDAFVGSTDALLNEPLWESFYVEDDPEVTTDAFFDIYTERTQQE
ncbi:MAG: peptidylprolyl isomerase [Eubacteriales bacterium]|nr:peptidylprolyl isomerase [Eubacteriales bacterium]